MHGPVDRLMAIPSWRRGRTPVAAFDAATPAPDPARKRDNIAMAEKTFADLQGSEDTVRQTSQRGPMGALLNGVQTMLTTLTTRGGLAATTAIVAVGLIAVLPQTREILTPKGRSIPS